jgi:hypothetical protein
LFDEGEAMSVEENGRDFDVDLKPLVGLLAGVSQETIEQLAVDAIKRHRVLVERAEALFRQLPDDVRAGKGADDTSLVPYLSATIEMHAQMSALTTLLKILGRTPGVS